MTLDDKWMDAQQVMDYLGIARSTLSLYIKQGKLKRFERLGRVVFLRTQVEALGEPKPKPPKQ